jgi:hypothetical protein
VPQFWLPTVKGGPRWSDACIELESPGIIADTFVISEACKLDASCTCLRRRSRCAGERGPIMMVAMPLVAEPYAFDTVTENLSPESLNYNAAVVSVAEFAPEIALPFKLH